MRVWESSFRAKETATTKATTKATATSESHGEPIDKNLQQQMRGVERLAALWQEALSEGSPAAVERHKRAGKLTARERIDQLIDPGAFFFELMPFAGYAQDPSGAKVEVGASVVVGVSLIAQRLVLVVANVPTAKGGAINKWTLQKMLRASEIAEQNKLPVVYLVESSGADLTQQSEIYNLGGAEFREITRRSKMGLPTIAVVFGNSTAGGAYIPGMADYVVVVEKAAQVFLAGPPLVKMAINEDVSAEDLGGAYMHASKSGLADYLVQSEAESFVVVREIVENFPKDQWPNHDTVLSSMATINNENEKQFAPHYEIDELLSILSADVRVPYDSREVIARITDGSRFLEFKALYGTNLIAVNAKIMGQSVGILANNGVITHDCAQKGAQFIQLCNRRGHPIIFLQNITGFMVGKQAEESGIIKFGAQLINAVSNSEVPAITIIIGASYGAGNYGMCGRAYQPRFLFSLPCSRLAVMGAEQLSGVLSLIQKEKMAKATPAEIEKMNQQQEQLKTQVANESDAFFGSGRLWDDGVIDPRECRKVLALCLRIVSRKIDIKGGDFGVFRN